jgi:hypothetical protein
VSVDSASIRKLIFWPAVITLAITVLRLVGELLNWSPALFNRTAGGGGAAIGISWLPPVFGILFAIQLVRMGHGPASGGRAIARAVLGVVTTAAVIAIGVATRILGDQQFSIGGLLLFTAALAAGAAVAWSGWPDLGRTLLGYGLAARIPVLVVMFLAMALNWGTHYDALPPGVGGDMGLVQKWVFFGLVPQMTTWLAITVLSGALFGAIAGAVSMRRAGPVARPAVA